MLSIYNCWIIYSFANSCPFLCVPHVCAIKRITKSDHRVAYWLIGNAKVISLKKLSSFIHSFCAISHQPIRRQSGIEVEDENSFAMANVLQQKDSSLMTWPDREQRTRQCVWHEILKLLYMKATSCMPWWGTTENGGNGEALRRTDSIGFIYLWTRSIFVH